MAQGNVFHGESQIWMREDNTWVHTAEGWKTAKGFFYWDGGQWVDILYHPPRIPPMGTELPAAASGTIRYVSQAIGYYFLPSYPVQNAGYDVAAVAASGRQFKVTFTRSASGNTNYWFHISCFANGNEQRIALSEYVSAGSNFSFILDAEWITHEMNLRWNGAPDGGGGHGREFGCTGYTLTML